MLLKKIAVPLALVLSLFTVSGCSTISNIGEQAANLLNGKAPTPVYRVAIIPFESLTPDRGVGITVSKLFYSQLSSADNITLSEEIGLRNWLKNQNININQLAKSTSAQALGQQLDVDRILLGSVSRYGHGNDPYGDPAVAISAQLVDVKTGKVLWASSQNRTVDDSFWSSNETTESLAQELVDELAEDIIDVK